ncbi:hypothetical protein C3941_13715 [Kaistia algarum]|uniref:hypothetical protein n=1 Tax=Kaistia algarum TaxID=2083279 RepID=UPI000CE8B04D|nr:hypothetical protein [Kaistia algarum]MCX5513727.1 hypothetical protein [Kaistia algarum]PPE79401.1 hypothetical protein C3941_13715 [Kaistia algarum]
MRDLASNLGIVNAIDPAVYAADNTPAAIDLLGFDSAVLSLHIGAGGITFSGTNKIEFVLTDSDDDVTYAAVTDADVQGVSGISGGIIKSLKTAHAAADVTKIGYVGNKRYLKLLADFSGTHGTGTPIAALVIKGHARAKPVA